MPARAECIKGRRTIPDYRTVIIVDQPRHIVYRAVSEVERYPEFLKYWYALEKTELTETHWAVDHAVGFKGRRYRFRTIGEIDPPERIVLRTEEAPFRAFVAQFDFEPLDADRTRLSFFAEYKLRSRALELIARQATGRLMEYFIAQFLARADSLARREDRAGRA